MHSTWAGHNAQPNFLKWQYYGGVMVDGDYITQTGSFAEHLEFDFLLNGSPKDKESQQYDGIWVSVTNIPEVKKVVRKDNYQPVEFYKDVKNKALLELTPSSNISRDRNVLIWNFVFDQEFVNSDKYLKVIKEYPSLLPNHAYKYSVDKHFGRGKAIVNSNINAKIYL